MSSVSSSSFLLSDYAQNETCFTQPCVLSHRLSLADKSNFGKQFSTTTGRNTDLFPNVCVNCLLLRYGLYESSHGETMDYMNCIVQKTQGVGKLDRKEGTYLRAFKVVENIVPEQNVVFPANCIVLPVGQILTDVFMSDPDNLFVKNKNVPSLKAKRIRRDVVYLSGGPQSITVEEALVKEFTEHVDRINRSRNDLETLDGSIAELEMQLKEVLNFHLLDLKVELDKYASLEPVKNANQRKIDEYRKTLTQLELVEETNRTEEQKTSIVSLTNKITEATDDLASITAEMQIVETDVGRLNDMIAEIVDAQEQNQRLKLHSDRVKLHDAKIRNVLAHTNTVEDVLDVYFTIFSVEETKKIYEIKRDVFLQIRDVSNAIKIEKQNPTDKRVKQMEDVIASIVALVGTMVAANDSVIDGCVSVSRWCRSVMANERSIFDKHVTDVTFVFSPYVYAYFAHLFHVLTSSSTIKDVKRAAKSSLEQLLCDPTGMDTYCLTATFEVDLLLMSNLVNPLAAKSHYVKRGENIVVPASKQVEVILEKRDALGNPPLLSPAEKETANSVDSPTVKISYKTDDFLRPIPVVPDTCLDATKLQHLNFTLFRKLNGTKQIISARKEGLKSYFDLRPGALDGDIVSMSGLHVASFCVPAVIKKGDVVYREFKPNVRWIEGIGLVSISKICQNELLIIDETVSLENFARAKLNNHRQNIEYKVPDLEPDALRSDRNELSFRYENRNLNRPKACLYARM